ncbi:MAG: hypothetical protein KDA37_02680, partial [Planctomycetales bacterium]|nr:hypothetical protein [Planctomycetales bacterium]
YVNGVEVGRNSTMTLNPGSLGATNQNYLGKSQYSDPYLDGTLDDFRIYNRALSAAELLGMSDPPNVPGDYNRDNTVNAADYTVYRDALGTAAPAFSSADGNGNGRIDREDYSVWALNYGQTYAPEPPDFLLTTDAEAPATATDEYFGGYAVVETPTAPIAPAAPTSGASAPTGDLDLLLLLVDSHESALAEADAPIRGSGGEDDPLDIAFSQQGDDASEVLAPFPSLLP